MTMETKIVKIAGDSDDTFRQTFAPMEDNTKASVTDFKEQCRALLHSLRATYQAAANRGDPADLHYFDLFQTSLEQAAMWGVKGLTK